MTEPYRDENESLRAENERLRAALAKRRGVGRGLTVLLVALDFVAIVTLLPWLNGPSDAGFWGASAIVAGIAVAAVLSVVTGGKRG